MTNKSAFYATFPAPTRASPFYMNACLKFQFDSCQNIATVSLMTDKKNTIQVYSTMFSFYESDFCCQSWIDRKQK